MKPGTWGARLADYYRWKARTEMERMELAAKIDIRILKLKEAEEARKDQQHESQDFSLA